MKKVILSILIATFFGCGQGQDVVPEPNSATCAPESLQKILKGFCNESNRLSFAQDCKSFDIERQINRPQFKPSSPSRY